MTTTKPQSTTEPPQEPTLDDLAIEAAALLDSLPTYVNDQTIRHAQQMAFALRACIQNTRVVDEDRLARTLQAEAELAAEHPHDGYDCGGTCAFHNPALRSPAAAATAAPVEQSDEVTLVIPTCGQCPFVDHSGAFTPGGAQPICGHRDAPSTFAVDIAGDERFHWKYRQVNLESAPPDQCPLRQPVTDDEGAR